MQSFRMIKLGNTSSKRLLTSYVSVALPTFAHKLRIAKTNKAMTKMLAKLGGRISC
jgi:hypothetical protein